MTLGPPRSLILWFQAKMDQEKGLLNVKFILKILPNGSVDRTKVISRVHVES